METPVAAYPHAALTAEQWIARTMTARELFRVDSTLRELLDMPPLVHEASRLQRDQLINYYRGRRAVLAQELGL